METEIKVGDVFHDSWGYDQTNVDFCQIVEVSPTGKTVKCRMMNQKIIPFEKEGYSSMAEMVAPSEPVGDEFRLRVKTHGRCCGEIVPLDRMCLVGQYPFCNNESKRFGHFWKYDHPLYQSHYA